jgi:hypothetical protein
MPESDWISGYMGGQRNQELMKADHGKMKHKVHNNTSMCYYIVGCN